MLEELCTVSECKRFVSNKCQVFNEGGRQYRIRYGYCPIPDYPKTMSVADKLRIGQTKSKGKWKKSDSNKIK